MEPEALRSICVRIHMIHLDSYGFIRSVLEAVDSVIDNGPSHGHPKAALTESEAAFPSFPRAHEQAEGEEQRRAI